MSDVVAVPHKNKKIYYDLSKGIISDSLSSLEKYIQEHNINSIIDRPSIDDDEMQGFIFVLTTKCNLNCHYCYSITQNKPLSMQRGDTIKILEKNIRADSKYIFINFFGGEPTLKMDLIKETVEYLKKEVKDKSVFFRISTNGLLNSEDLDYLIDNNFHIGVSSDGVFDKNSSHIKQRVAQRIEKTLMHLVKRNAIFSVRNTVTSDNYNNLNDTIQYWHSIGVKLAHIEPYNPIGVSEKEMSLIPEKQAFINSFKNAIDKATELGMWISNGIYMNLLTPSSYFCTGASGRFKVYNPDGSISTCYRVQSFDTPYPDFIIGNWKNDVLDIKWTKNKETLNTHTVDSIKSCGSCNIKYVCSGGCLMRNFTQNGEVTKPDKWVCGVKQMLLKDAILKIWEALINKRKPVVLGIFVFENLFVKNPSISPINNNNKDKKLSMPPLFILNNQQQQSTFDVFESTGINRNDEDTIFNKKITRSECF